MAVGDQEFHTIEEFLTRLKAVFATHGSPGYYRGQLSNLIMNDQESVLEFIERFDNLVTAIVESLFTESQIDCLPEKENQNLERELALEFFYALPPNFRNYVNRANITLREAYVEAIKAEKLIEIDRERYSYFNYHDSKELPNLENKKNFDYPRNDHYSNFNQKNIKTNNVHYNSLNFRRGRDLNYERNNDYRETGNTRYFCNNEPNFRNQRDLSNLQFSQNLYPKYHINQEPNKFTPYFYPNIDYPQYVENPEQNSINHIRQNTNCNKIEIVNLRKETTDNRNKILGKKNLYVKVERNLSNNKTEDKSETRRNTTEIVKKSAESHTENNKTIEENKEDNKDETNKLRSKIKSQIRINDKAEFETKTSDNSDKRNDEEDTKGDDKFQEIKINTNELNKKGNETKAEENENITDEGMNDGENVSLNKNTNNDKNNEENDDNKLRNDDHVDEGFDYNNDEKDYNNDKKENSLRNVDNEDNVNAEENILRKNEERNDDQEDKLNKEDSVNLISNGTSISSINSSMRCEENRSSRLRDERNEDNKLNEKNEDCRLSDERRNNNDSYEKENRLSNDNEENDKDTNGKNDDNNNEENNYYNVEKEYELRNNDNDKEKNEEDKIELNEENTRKIEIKQEIGIEDDDEEIMDDNKKENGNKNLNNVNEENEELIRRKKNRRKKLISEENNYNLKHTLNGINKIKNYYVKKNAVYKFEMGDRVKRLRELKFWPFDPGIRLTTRCIVA